MLFEIKNFFILIFVFFLILISVSNFYYKIYPKDWRKIINENKESYSTTIKKIDHLYKNQSTIEFLRGATNSYKESVSYKWPDKPINMLTISLFDNWILHFSRFLDPLLAYLNVADKNTQYFTRFESYKYQRALGRGFGICSQNAIGLADLLYSRYNIKAKIIALGDHIIVEVNEDNNFYILDPSIGIFIPFSVKFASENLTEMEKYYTGEYAYIAKSFDIENNMEAHNYGSSNYYDNYYKMIAVKYFEIITDILSIIIPIIIIFFIFKFYKKK